MNDLQRPQFLPDLLIAALGRNGDQPCLLLADDELTAREVGAEISRYVQAYQASGIVQGDGIATLSKNRPEVLFSMGATMLTGCRGTPLHPLGSVDDQAYILEDAEIETLIFDPSFADRALQLAERVPGLRRLLSYGPVSGATDLVALASCFGPQPLVAPAVTAEDCPALSYTGGTTGVPKGVVATYRSSAAMAQIMYSEWQWPDEVRHLVCTPLSHAGAGFLVPVLLHGGMFVVLPVFEAGAVLEAIERHRITTMMLVPSMIYALLDHPKLARTDTSSLETVFYGASPVSPSRLQEAIAAFGPVFFQFYGQTECPQTVSVLRKEEHLVDNLGRLASCGRPVPWIRVGLLDDEGHEVPRGQPGELCVQGTLVAKGYWNRPDETAKLFEHGWLHTGDVAQEDDQGFLTIVDRKKDMIVTGGFNVYPREVEDVIATLPWVKAVAVIGVPDDKWGEAVTAVVVPSDPEQVDTADLVRLVKERKGSHHAPKRIELVETIPVTPVGKPDKKTLRATYWSPQARGVN